MSTITIIIRRMDIYIYIGCIIRIFEYVTCMHMHSARGACPYDNIYFYSTHMHTMYYSSSMHSTLYILLCSRYAYIRICILESDNTKYLLLISTICIRIISLYTIFCLVASIYFDILVRPHSNTLHSKKNYQGSIYKASLMSKYQSRYCSLSTRRFPSTSERSTTALKKGMLVMVWFKCDLRVRSRLAFKTISISLQRRKVYCTSSLCCWSRGRRRG